MYYAYVGERETGSLCGSLDQAVAFGSNILVKMLFNNNHLVTQNHSFN